MAGWLESVRARKAKGAGEVKVDFAGTRLSVKLKYPPASSRVRIGELIDEFKAKAKAEGKDETVKTRFEFSDRLELVVVKECIDTADATDEELTILIRETGGTESPLVQRCAQLIGVEGILGGGGDDKEKTEKR